MPKSIYLAGKVRASCWRHTLVKGLRETFTGGEYDAESIMPVHKPWPVMQGAVLGLDYTGPYFISCDHGCYHGERTHGLGPAPKHGACPELPREDIVRLCFDAIQRSDIVFAWIEDETAYGTLAELGYAKATGKTIWIAGPEVTSEYVYDMRSELWFTFTMADKRLPYPTYLTPLAALTHLIPPQFDSPIEEKFWHVWTQMGNPFKLVPQYPIDRYRVDFAYPPAKVAIELDGHATHSSPDAIAHDRKRQREIEDAGWKVVRFGGKEVWADASKCANETLVILKRYVIKQRVDTGLTRIQQMQEKAKEPTSPQKTETYECDTCGLSMPDEEIEAWEGSIICQSCWDYKMSKD